LTPAQTSERKLQAVKAPRKAIARVTHTPELVGAAGLMATPTRRARKMIAPGYHAVGA
jgi:hypothetical protein